jgi:hypothetical protein
VVLPTGSKIHDIISIIYLRSFKDTTDDIRPLPIEIDGEEEYTIERIDGERINSLRGREFLVKWEGYGDLERTWEPPEYLDHTPDILREWNKKRVETKTPSRRSPRETRHKPSE